MLARASKIEPSRETGSIRPPAPRLAVATCQSLCGLCHSTVDDALPPGIGRRLDGWANRDLNIGAIAALGPNLQPVANVLGVDQATVRQVFLAWGPGKFDAELLLDNKRFRPDGQSAFRGSSPRSPPTGRLCGPGARNHSPETSTFTRTLRHRFRMAFSQGHSFTRAR
jgi:hypothetical protein